MNRIVIIKFFILLILNSAAAQNDTSFNKKNLTLRQYIQLVSTNNLEYAAQKYNVSITEAEIEVAKLRPDPYLSADWTGNHEEGRRSGYEISSELGMTIELGGKRKARTNLARSENEVSRALLADYFRNLQSEACLIYLEALRQKKMLDVNTASYLTMKQLADADSIRFSLGSIKEIDAVQSKLEAAALYNELIQTSIEWKNSIEEMKLMTGTISPDTLFVPMDLNNDTCKIFSLENLLVAAKENRADLQAALLSKDVGRNFLTLTKKERITDIDFRMGATNIYKYEKSSPLTRDISGGLEIPLKFSNLSKANIKIAQARANQAEEIYRQAELQIISEVTQSWNLYSVHCRQVENYDLGMLDMASEVIKGKIYSYKRGETSLLEVLNAQRTFNEIQKSYYDALFNRAAALVILETSAGILDPDF